MYYKSNLELIFHKVIIRRIFHVYPGGHFVVVVLVKQQKYTFNSTVNVEIMSKMFENINK